MQNNENNENNQLQPRLQTEKERERQQLREDGAFLHNDCHQDFIKVLLSGTKKMVPAELVNNHPVNEILTDIEWLDMASRSMFRCIVA